MLTLVLAALPDEHSHLRELLGPRKIVCRRPFRMYAFSPESGKALLVETGMGMGAAKGALRWALDAHTPNLLISMGFAGGLDEKMKVGDVFIVREALLHTDLAAQSPQTSIRFDIPAPADLFSSEKRIGVARLVTTSGVGAKPILSRIYGDFPTLVDMESFAIAGLAMERRIPFLCVRSVSDALEDEIDFGVEEISDASGRLSLKRVILSVVRRPGLIRSFHRAHGRSVRAARSLGRATASLLNLPAPVLGDIALGLTLQAGQSDRQLAP